MKVDFHSHTYCSDGTLSPAELVAFMAERKVEIFSISDHDTLDAYAALAVPAGTQLVTGVEINATWRDNEVHILGYGLPLGESPLGAMLERNRRERRARVERIVTQLQRGGYSITFDDVLREAQEARALGRPHVAKALIRAGIVDDVEQAFRMLLRRGRPGYVPSTHVTPLEAIDAIATSGGVAVLAHPGRLKDRSLIDELAERGLHGIEVFYPLHDADDVRLFRAKAEEHGLVTTAGMDFHDLRYHTRGVGIDVDPDDLRPFFDLVGIG